MIYSLKQLQLGLLIILVGVFFCTFCLSCCPSLVQASETSKVVMVVIDRISLQDLVHAPTPNLHRLMQQGAVGLMNTNTGSSRNPFHSYVTIGAGNRSVTGNLGGLAFNAEERYLEEEARHFYYGFTGKEVESHNLVHLGLAQIIQNNRQLKQTVVPGSLGEALGVIGVKTAVIGNADTRLSSTPEDRRRLAVSIAMDRRGVVDYGEVSSYVLQYKNSFPFALSTDWTKLNNLYQQLAYKARLIVIETGDTARLDEYKEYLLPTRLQNEKEKTLEEIDDFLGQIIPSINIEKDLLIVISPTASKGALLAGNSLTPLIIFGKGIQPGFLISSTTHRAGIITNLDVAPTIIDFLGGKIPYYMSGQPLYSVKGVNVLPTLLKTNEQIVHTSNQRPPVLKTFITLQIIALLIAVPVILFSHSLPKEVLKALQIFLLALAAVPLLLLFLPLLKISNIVVVFLFLIFSCSLFAFLVSQLTRNKIDPFIILGLSTSLSILLDLFLGSPLMKTSLLGYDPMIGARFYGIGNEYSGVLLGSSILGSTALLQRFSKGRKYLNWLVWFFFLLIIFVSASPKFGTDVGGTITSLAAFLVVYLKISGKKINLRILVIGIISILFLLGLLFLFDMSRGGGNNTHIGRAARLVETGGWQAAGELVQRKLATNWRLIRYTIWTRVLLTSLAALAILFFRPMGVLRRIIQNYPCLNSGFIGILIASVMGLIFNDSGVVQAATTILYAVFTLVYLVIDERRNRE